MHCCDSQQTWAPAARIYLVFYWKIFDSVFNLQFLVPFYNVLTLQVSFRLFIILSAAMRFFGFCQFTDRLWQVTADMIFNSATRARVVL